MTVLSMLSVAAKLTLPLSEKANFSSRGHGDSSLEGSKCYDWSSIA